MTLLTALPGVGPAVVDVRGPITPVAVEVPAVTGHVGRIGTGAAIGAEVAPVTADLAPVAMHLPVVAARLTMRGGGLGGRRRGRGLRRLQRVLRPGHGGEPECERESEERASGTHGGTPEVSVDWRGDGLPAEMLMRGTPARPLISGWPRSRHSP
jgi:hypothetical protein